MSCDHCVVVIVVFAAVQSIAAELLSKWMAVFREGQGGKKYIYIFHARNGSFGSVHYYCIGFLV